MALGKRLYEVTVFGNSNQIKYECNIAAEKPSLAAKMALVMYGVKGVKVTKHVENSPNKYIILVRLLAGARESEMWYQA